MTKIYRTEGLLTVGLIPDCHRPWHHRKAYALMIHVFKALGLDAVYILGDYGDFYGVNGHGPKHPGILQMLKDEVLDINAGLDELDHEFPDAKKYFIQGNHEFRFERYIQNKAPELFGLVSTQELFKMNQRPGWSFIAYGPNQSTPILGSRLMARHEPTGNRPKNVAYQAACSIVYAHIHKIEEESVVTLDGKVHTAFCVGWLGDKRKDEIFGYVKNHHQWQLGFGLVRINPKTGQHYHQKIAIKDDMTCVVDGKLFSLPAKLEIVEA